MNGAECGRQAAVLDALGAGGREGMDAALREHVALCASCGDLVAVASAVLDEHQTAMSAARVPTAATVWWRVQLRARREAAIRATRPITLWQALAAACGLGGLAAAVGFAVPSVRGFFNWTLGSLGTAVGGMAGWPDVHWSHPAVIVAVLVATLFAVVMPLALYLAVRER